MGAVNVLPNTLAPKIEEGKPFDNPAFLRPSSTSPFALKMLNQHCGHWLDKLIEKDHLFKDTAQKELPINVANDDMAPAAGGPDCNPGWRANPASSFPLRGGTLGS